MSDEPKAARVYFVTCSPRDKDGNPAKGPDKKPLTCGVVEVPGNALFAHGELRCRSCGGLWPFDVTLAGPSGAILEEALSRRPDPQGNLL